MDSVAKPALEKRELLDRGLAVAQAEGIPCRAIIGVSVRKSGLILTDMQF